MPAEFADQGTQAPLPNLWRLGEVLEELLDQYGITTSRPVGAVNCEHGHFAALEFIEVGAPAG